MRLFLFTCGSSVDPHALKTSATNLTWRQSLNENGCMHLNKCHISFGFATSFTKILLAQNLEEYTFLCGTLLKIALSPRTACWHTPPRTYEETNCVIGELFHIIVDQQDPHSPRSFTIRLTCNKRAMKYQKSSFVKAFYLFLDLLEHSEAEHETILRHHLHVAVLRSSDAQGENSDQMHSVCFMP